MIVLPSRCQGHLHVECFCLEPVHILRTIKFVDFGKKGEYFPVSSFQLINCIIPRVIGVVYIIKENNKKAAVFEMLTLLRAYFMLSFHKDFLLITLRLSSILFAIMLLKEIIQKI